MKKFDKKIIFHTYLIKDYTNKKKWKKNISWTLSYSPLNKKSSIIELRQHLSVISLSIEIWIPK